MIDQLSLYWFPGSVELNDEILSRFVPNGDGEEMTAMIGDVVLRFGSFDGDKPGVIIETSGETAFVVSEPFVDPLPPDAILHGEDY